MAAVFRHADRTPKQKLKFTSGHPLLLEFFKDSQKEVKLKKSGQLSEILETILKILEDVSPSGVPV